MAGAHVDVAGATALGVAVVLPMAAGPSLVCRGRIRRLGGAALSPGAFARSPMLGILPNSEAYRRSCQQQHER